MFILGGLALFALIYYSPAWPDAVDPKGEHFALSIQAKGALAVFAVAATWWIFEVVPIGVTSLLIGTLQALFLIRKPVVAFKDFMDLQSDFAKKSFDQMIAGTSKVSDLAVKVANEAFEPLAQRVNETIEKVSKKAA